MFHSAHTRLAASLSAMLLATGWPTAVQAGAAPARHDATAAPDVATDFALLARQRPWRCAGDSATGTFDQIWRAEPAQCAWQNRLRMRRWRGPAGMTGSGCVSAEAAWWTWARGQGAAPAGTPWAWRGHWPTQSLQDGSGPEQRTVIMRRQADGQWEANEWRWLPSERAATRRWQQGRWNELAARAGQLRQPAAGGAGARETQMLWAVLEQNLGQRAGEINGESLRWVSDGQCLLVDGAALGPQQLQLSYAVDDSRLEQRAAMQLQLARRHPKAVWLTPFSQVPTVPAVRSGAKFYAVWLEERVLSGQLWMPTRADGPLVRVRITTPLAPAPQARELAIAAAKRVVERELLGLAARWAQRYE